MATDGMEQLSAYELERLETMRKNREQLVHLGLEDVTSEIRAEKEAKATAKKEREKRMPPPKRQTPAPPTRVSKRQRQEKPSYTGERIDRWGDEIDGFGGRSDRRAAKSALTRRQRGELGEDEEEDSEEDEDMTKEDEAAALRQAEANALLESARAKLFAEQAAAATSCADDAAWRAEAVRQWGEAVSCEAGGWKDYVASRVATPAPPSPIGLLQEHYAAEPWKLLVACALMSRVSSWETKSRCIDGFFSNWPTPSALMGAKAAEVEQVIYPLGLFHEARWPALVAISTRFLEMPRFDIGLDKEPPTPQPRPAALAPPAAPRATARVCMHTTVSLFPQELKIRGCGKFTVDSYFLFCRADKSCQPDDKALRPYAKWLNKSRS